MKQGNCSYMIFFFLSKFWHRVFSANQKSSSRIMVMLLLCVPSRWQLLCQRAEERALEAQEYLSPFLSVAQGTLVSCSYCVPKQVWHPLKGLGQGVVWWCTPFIPAFGKLWQEEASLGNMLRYLSPLEKQMTESHQASNLKGEGCHFPQ